MDRRDGLRYMMLRKHSNPKQPLSLMTYENKRRIDYPPKTLGLFFLLLIGVLLMPMRKNPAKKNPNRKSEAPS
jgi:hypothetical protein